ncbi:enoyl-CoA hydratase/isomerase family protein [Stappia sp. F7233]|uniref:Enoyl-CoA hydratase/isomerase family protein n=1 Tax=Stappia albiluteola TaxID=2758565 RepID=A0A839AD71_9HYPH|nr:enoyl-CoA hydratase [Stappia albiluteola]MBA5777623.1 enoyl-CoA hydratase/isomerase family protein [Stappia albiluteola]
MTSSPSPAPRGSVRTEIDGPLGWLVIDNPARRNAITLAMWREIPLAVARLAGDEAVRVIVLRGAGERTFIAGADISEFETTRKDAVSARTYEAANAAAFDALRDCAKPTIAMIRGFCLGGGLGLAMACDMRIAEEGSVFGIPAARLGVGYPPDAVRDAVKLVGPSRAKELFFTARQIGAAEALKIGLIDRIAPADGLDVEIGSLVAAISENAPLTIQAAKAAIDAVSGDPDRTDWAHVRNLAEACFDSADFAEGRRAFLEKRVPRFSGR